MFHCKTLFSVWMWFFIELQYKPTYAVPPDYCFHKLNRDNCNANPTPVFYYYHPGSRCEIALWRGCPTYNKFSSEYECSRTCIYRFRMDYSNLQQLTADSDWEEKIKEMPDDDANMIIDIINDILSSTVPTTKVEFIKVPESLTDIIDTRTTPAEADKANEIENVDQIPQNVPATTTLANLAETTENVLNPTDTNTEAITNNATTTTTAVNMTTDNMINTEATQATIEVTSTTVLVNGTGLPSTDTAITGHPTEVEIMRIA